MAALALVVSGLTAIPLSPANADTCAPNPIVCENAKTGSPEEDWDINGAGDDSIQGYATDISVNAGQTISFKISTPATSYTINVYRLGWYNGLGARFITSVAAPAHLPQRQPPCVTDPTTQIYDCGNWSVSASWPVPTTAVSGVYIAKLTRTDDDDQEASQITFVVRNDASTSVIDFKTSDNTWQAYNTFGGSDFYEGDPNGRSYKLSLNRPFATRGANDGRDFLFSNEYPMIRFLERNGYDVSYTTDVDADRHGSLIKNHKVFMSTGHDEYWSGAERTNVEAARDAGVNLAFFSGNEVYWKTRWESSEDGANTPYRTLVCYKETWDNTKSDPSPEWTGTWRDPRFSPPANGGNPENSLTGTEYMSNSDDLPLQVPAAQGHNRIWNHTSAYNLGPGTSVTLAQHIIGYESDEDVDNGFRPAGLIWLSTTVGSTPQELQDFGNTVSAGTTTHHLTLYKAPSGALVFSAGTIQWAWGLDNDHDGNASSANQAMQQATVNLFADLGAQPATLMSGVQPAAKSTDTQAPTATITAPAGGTSVANGARVTVQGTASDTGGGSVPGVVAGVEVSTDGGTSWHAATGTTSWSYSFYASGVNSQAVRVRAIDDSANIQPTPATLTLAITGTDSLFGTRVPNTPAVDDSSAVELGVKVVPQDDGYIKGIRFYKGSGNTGTHTGTLWTVDGNPLATGTFTGESSSGWQTMMFSAPVPVIGGTTYVASYFAPNGHYAADSLAFSYRDFSSPPLSAPRSLGEDNGNGVFTYGDEFPTRTSGDTNYYVDVVYTDSEAGPPTIVSSSPAAGATTVAIGAHPTATFSKPVDPSTVQFSLTDSQNVAVAGSTGYDAGSRTVTFTPSANLATSRTYTVTVHARDLQGLSLAGTATWSFTTDQYTSIGTLFADTAVPQDTSIDDFSAVELGVKFTTATNGWIVGVRYYQGSGNTGIHTGSLWTSTGTMLAKATFSGETGSGWQSVRFATPVSVVAGTTYVASYYAPHGHYAVNSGFFAMPYSRGLLTAATDSNGVYIYGAGDAFPTNSYQSANYWVDPLFVSDGTTPSPSPSPSPSSSPSPSPSPSASPSPSPTVSPTPIPVPSGAVTLFGDSDTPDTASWPDLSAVEVGVRFSSDVAGQVLGVRFYKGTSNTGTHTGSLWTSTGQLLATATFTGETGSGWQTVLFSQPVTIVPGTTYEASYTTTVGYYAATVNGFTDPLDRGHLHVQASGGAYHYGSGFPDSTSAHNYWVDVIFRPNS